MQKKIIEAILNGQGDREIADWARPKLTHVTVWRFRKQVVGPTMVNAEILKAALPPKMIEKKPFEHDVTVTESVTGNVSLMAEQVKQLATQAILAAPALQIRENRIRLNQDIANRLMTVVNERAADMSVCERCRQPAAEHPYSDPDDSTKRCLHFIAVPGGTSGLIVRKLKKDGFEYAVDTGLLGEVREYQRQTAIELGQWQEGATGQVSIQIVCPSAPGGDQTPRITFSSVDQIEAAAEPDEDNGILEIGVLQKNE